MNRKDLDALNELYLSVYVWEEVETWVSSLIKEGYDLSDYTWEEMYEAYLEEAPVTGNTFVDRILQGGQAFFQGKPRPSGVVTPEIRAAQQKADWKREALLKSTPGYDKTKGTTLRNDKPTVLAQRGADDGVMEPGKPETWEKKDISSDEFDRYRQVRSDDQMQKDALANGAARRREETRRREEKPPVPGTQPAGSSSTPPSITPSGSSSTPPSITPSGSSSTPPPRPAASSTVLAKQKGVEGKLDKATGKFSSGAFSSAEKSRYSSVAAQNAARTSAASGTTPKPVASTAPPTATTADKIKGGLSNYQSQVKSGDVKGAEETGKSTFALANPKLAAAQAEKDRIRGTSQTDNPLMKDMKDRMPMTPSVQSPTLAKDLGVGTPSSSGNQSLLDNPNASKAAKPTPPTPEIPQATKTTPNINKLKTESKVEQLNWPSIKTVRDIADAYTDIYEKHNDGNLANNYPPYNKVTRGDVIAGATGNDEMGGNDKMGRKKKKKPSNKKRMNPYLKAINSDFEMWIDGLLNEGYDLSNYTWNEVYEIYENAIVLTEEEYGIYSLVLEHLLSNGYAETEHDANIIIENMSDKWVDVIIDEAYKGGPEFGMKYSKPKPPSGKVKPESEKGGYGGDEKFTKPDDKIEKPGTTVPPFKKGGYGRIMSNIPHGIGAHRDKIASRITTTTGGDPGAPTSQKMRAPDKKRLSREIVRKKPQA